MLDQPCWTRLFCVRCWTPVSTADGSGEAIRHLTNPEAILHRDNELTAPTQAIVVARQLQRESRETGSYKRQRPLGIAAEEGEILQLALVMPFTTRISWASPTGFGLGVVS